MKNIYRCIFLMLIISCQSQSIINITYDYENTESVLNLFKPFEQVFIINSSEDNRIVCKKGTELIFQKDSFIDENSQLISGDITVIVEEALDSVDIAGTQVTMEYYRPDGTRTLFQSAGMYKVTAKYNGVPVFLAEEKTIEVKFPNVEPGDEFNMYYLNEEGAWVYHGHNQEIPQNTEVSTVGVYGTREYYIDLLTWWNCDLPIEEIACLKGKIADPEDILGEKVQVTAIYTDVRGANSVVPNGLNFNIDVIQGVLVRVIVLDENGNMGISEVIHTTNNQGTMFLREGPNNYYQDIGEIIIKKVDDLVDTSDEFKSRFNLENIIRAQLNIDFFEAVETHAFNKASDLLNRGADIDAFNSYGETALISAASYDDIDAMEYLIEKGADLEIKENGYSGDTALIVAAQSWETEAMELLIAHGANVNAQNNYGDTALLSIYHEGGYEMAELLLQNGADVNIKNNEGFTVLMQVAGLSGYMETIKLLLSYDADIYATDNSKNNAIFYAEEQGNSDIVQLLLNY